MITPKPTDKISQHFTWKEALWLPRWDRMGNETDGLTQDMLANLEFLFKKMDVVRELAKVPIIVHVAWRSIEYNRLVEGATSSAHLAKQKNVAAVDFHVEDMTCRNARILFLSYLGIWKMRMENNGSDANWIHMDTKPVPANGNRFFKP